jgi:hypothetical protein
MWGKAEGVVEEAVVAVVVEEVEVEEEAGVRTAALSPAVPCPICMSGAQKTQSS